METKAEITIFENQQALAEGFADWFYNFLKDKPVVNVALSGGSTPKLFFQVLSEQYKNRIDWSNLQVFWGDERCVPPDHDESNYLMTRQYLLDKVPIPQENIHRIQGEAPPEKEAERYGELIAGILPQRDRLPVFDLVILGLGSDGHTASIFPGQLHLLESDNFCQVATHPESGQQRISLTGKVINHATNICFLVAGEEKCGVVAEIVNKTGNWKKHPASYILPDGQRPLCWFLDSYAANGIREYTGNDV